jgi:two-component system, cell cycle response regulator DivK
MSNSWQILVIEDEYDSIQMVSKILTFHGIEVHVAHNGRECLDMLNDLNPTLIVSDLAMPEMDGWQTLAAIRANPQTEHIPVVAVTAYHSADVAEEAMRAGFDGFFAKPVSARTFVQQLKEIVQK